MKLLLSLIICLIASSSAYAGPFNLPVLTDTSQTDSVFKTLAATTAFRPLQGASTFGSIFGFAFGITAQSTSASQIASLIGGNTNIGAGDINAALQLPLGLAVEAGFLPNLNISNTSLSRFGGDVKWTLNSTVLSGWPVDVALRGMYTTTNLSYTQGLNGGTMNIGYTSNITGGTLMVSKSFVVIEPYISYGLLSQSSTLTGTGTTTLYGGNIPPSTTSVSGSGSSGIFEVGAELRLVIFTLAAEYANLFGSDSYAARVGFKF